MIVVARYKEDVAWLERENEPYFVVQKDEHLPNHGREPSSFLWYIIQHYDELEGMYRFRQGMPFDHWPYIAYELTCWKDHCVHHHDLPWALFNEKSGVDLPDEFTFHPGGQFDATAEQIKKHPKSFYENMYRLIEEDELVAWILERVWGVIFS